MLRKWFGSSKAAQNSWRSGRRARRPVVAAQVESLEVRSLPSATSLVAVAAPAATAAANDDFGNTAASAGTLNIGQTISGNLESAGDKDYFRMTLTAGRQYAIETRLGSVYDTTLTLFAANGTQQLAYNDDVESGTAGRSRASRILFTPTTSGTYFAAVGGYSTSYTGTYQIELNQVSDTVGNTAATARSLGTIGGGAVVTGRIDLPGDVDMYQVGLTAGRTYRFSTTLNTLADSTLTLLDRNGTTQLLINNDANGTAASQLDFSCVATGSYYIKVAGNVASQMGTYALSVQTLPDPAVRLDIWQTISGSLDAAGERDRYRLDLVAGQKYVIETRLGTLYDTTLTLTGPNGAQVAYNDDLESGTVGRSRASRIVYTPTVSGTYYATVAGYSASYTGTYQIELAPVIDGVGSTAATAYSLGTITGGMMTSGRIDLPGDVDMFRVELTAGRTYRFSTSLGTLPDSTLALFDRNGTTQLLVNDDSNGTKASQIDFVCQASGSYYLKVAGAVTSQMGNYSLTVAALSDQPNAVDFLNCPLIPTGQTANASIDYDGDLDVFHLDVIAGARYRVSTTLGTLPDSVMTLYGAVFTSRTVLATSDDVGTSKASAIEFVADRNGTDYFVQVASKALAGAVTNRTGTYSMRLEMIAPPDDYADDPTGAAAIDDGQILPGSLERVGDRDVFKMSLIAGFRYRFTTSLGTLQDSLLELSGSIQGPGFVQGFATDNDDGANTRASQIDLVCPFSGDYYLTVSSSAKATVKTGTYSIRAQQMDEHGETPALATDLGVLTSEKWLTDIQQWDPDCFKFTTRQPGQRGDTVRIAFDSKGKSTDASDDSEFGLLLRDASGAVIGQSQGSGMDAEFVSLEGCPAGTYYIEVFRRSGSMNSRYSLIVSPPGAPATSRTLFLNFDGATFSCADMARWSGARFSSGGTDRWAGGQWNNLAEIDAGLNATKSLSDRYTNAYQSNTILVDPYDAIEMQGGVPVSRPPEQRNRIINLAMEFLRADLADFGFDVRRTTGFEENATGSTTVFVGNSNVIDVQAHYGLTGSVDYGNDDRKDIAFVMSEPFDAFKDEGLFDRIEHQAMQLADMILHEAGHTFGLYHVVANPGPTGNPDPNATVLVETMGLRYATRKMPKETWAQDTKYMDCELPPLDGDGAGRGKQNSYRTMLRNFGLLPLVRIGRNLPLPTALVSAVVPASIAGLSAGIDGFGQPNGQYLTESSSIGEARQAFSATAIGTKVDLAFAEELQLKTAPTSGRSAAATPESGQAREQQPIWSVGPSTLPNPLLSNPSVLQEVLYGEFPQ